MSTRQQEGDGIPAPPPRPPEPNVLPTVNSSENTRYQMAEKLAAIGEDYFVVNDEGQRVFKVDGKAAQLLDTLIFWDMAGNEICRIQHCIPRQRNSMEITDADGRQVAMVKKAMISPLRDRFVVKLREGLGLEVQGNILAHEYRIGNLANVSKSWFRVRNSYGVEIIPGQNDALILAATVCVDQMISDVR